MRYKDTLDISAISILFATLAEVCREVEALIRPQFLRHLLHTAPAVFASIPYLLLLHLAQVMVGSQCFLDDILHSSLHATVLKKRKSTSS